MALPVTCASALPKMVLRAVSICSIRYPHPTQDTLHATQTAPDSNTWLFEACHTVGYPCCIECTAMGARSDKKRTLAHDPLPAARLCLIHAIGFVHIVMDGWRTAYAVLRWSWACWWRAALPRPTMCHPPNPCHRASRSNKPMR